MNLSKLYVSYFVRYRNLLSFSYYVKSCNFAFKGHICIQNCSLFFLYNVFVLSNTEVWELMALVAWRLFCCSDIYIALYLSKPVQFGSRFMTSIHVQALLLTYVYVTNLHICK